MHRRLGEYFSSVPNFFDGYRQMKPNMRKYVEQPWQQTKGEMWDETTETLCDFNFIQAKIVAKLTFDLVKDYHLALDRLPESQQEHDKEKKQQKRMEKYVQDLIAYAKGEIKSLDIPQSTKPWSQEKIEEEIEHIKNSPTRVDRLRDFLHFIGQEADNLQNYAGDFPNFAYQQAWNYADSGPVGLSAEKLSPDERSLLLLRVGPCRPVWNPLPQVLQILRMHTMSVAAVS